MKRRLFHPLMGHSRMAPHRVRNFLMACLLTILTTATADSAPLSFKRLAAEEIRKSLIGREFTDEVHWFYRFKKNGMIEGASMGRRVNRMWQIQEGRLCMSAEKREPDCREVWKAGTRIELRRYADDPLPDTGRLRP